MEETSRKTSFSPFSRNQLYEFFCTSIRFGISRTSLIFPKFIRTFFPHCFGVTCTIGEKPPYSLSDMDKIHLPEQNFVFSKNLGFLLTGVGGMWYTIVLKYTKSHYDTFYNYMISPQFCQGDFFIFVEKICCPLMAVSFLCRLHNSKNFCCPCQKTEPKKFFVGTRHSLHFFGIMLY